jgi:hypothetical protein
LRNYSVGAKQSPYLHDLLHASFLVTSLGHVAGLGDEIGCLLASLRPGEHLLLMGRCRDISLTSCALTSSSSAGLLLDFEHLLLMGGRGEPGSCTARASL